MGLFTGRFKEKIMAKKDTVEALVLRDSQFGKVGEVVTLSKEDAKVGADDGALDLHPDAIKHAKG